jgi:peroxiredoxin (alkyl hydroperoxide reductase subunit C)
MWKKTSPTIKNVRFPMAADPSGAVSRAYGVWNPVSGMNKRGRFIINPKGTVMAVEVVVDPGGRNVDELIRQIQAMQTVAANPGKAAPAGWTPGDDLITTGKDDIGRY